MKYFITILLFLTTGLFPSDTMSIKNIPIQEFGRIKPLDTFARNNMLSLYGKRTLKHENLSAIEWMTMLFTNTDSAFNKDVFNINSPEIVYTLNLDWENNYHKYNYSEILEGIKSQQEYFSNLSNKPEENLTKKEVDFIDIYNKVYTFNELSRSLTCLLPAIRIEDPQIAKYLDIPDGEVVSYYFFIQNIEKFSILLKDFIDKDRAEWTDSDMSLSSLMLVLQQIEQDSFSKKLKIIPPDPYQENESWKSPWEILIEKKFTDKQNSLLIYLEQYIHALIDSDQESMNESILSYKKTLSEIYDVNTDKLNREVWYNDARLLYWSVFLYVMAFLFICISWIFKPNIFYNLGYSFVLGGCLIHFYAIINRMMIMDRPPVTTLYESVIFVAFITVLLSIIIEYLRKNSSGIFLASIIGSFLLFVSFGYESDGDTLGMLVAVLNSNFWLATHVVTITIGYGVTVVASMLAHLYLIKKIIQPDERQQLKKIYDSLLGVTLFALLFTLFGTILGGIWADQSWGRFWGWDPKENGALLIVLWLIMMLHLRITGLIKPLGFCFGMVFANITVALAWFGVNLLNVGLHSYGFTDNVATNLFLFIFVEFLFAVISYGFCRKYR